MKKFKISTVLVLLVLCGFSQQAAIRLYEYKPAPGQHINLENIGTPAAAQKMTEHYSNLVSLGSFGGYIVLGFETACINHPDNPYGIDFTVFGNSFSGSSEPGVIWVMQDENRNGLPDDTWYEIAGSSHFHSQTIRDHEVTYFKTGSRDVFWKSGSGESGWVLANSFNLQEYYPNVQYFPEYPDDSVTFRGTLLSTKIDFSNAQEIKVSPLAFGYADNRSRKQGIDLFLPDNPYTREVEGAGGDPVDISWAVDRFGNYVELDSIHFVKIVSGNLAVAGWLGDISTDVAWIETVRPNPEISGKENMLVAFPCPARILASDSLLIEACYFEKGKKADAEIFFISQNEKVVRVDSSGWIRAVNEGEAKILISAGGEADTAFIQVVIPDSIRCLSDLSSLYPGDSVELVAQVYDQELITLDVPVNFSSSRPAVGEIATRNGKIFFKALHPGETVLTMSVNGFSAEANIIVKVHSPEDKIRVYFTLKTGGENLLPFQWIEAGVADFNRFVQDPQQDYSDAVRPTLFHALAAGLQKAQVPFWFRDDEASGGELYLYAVEDQGLFYYGWGGKTEPAAFARAWVARVNNRSLVDDFYRIEISDGDTIALYHVSNIVNPWNYSRMLASYDPSASGNEIEVLLEQSVCTFSGGTISESELVPLAHAQVIAGTGTYYTGTDGRAVFVSESELPLVVSSGNDAVLISQNTITGAIPVPMPGFTVYPNPVHDELFIQGSLEQWNTLTEFRPVAPANLNTSPGGKAEPERTSIPVARVLAPDGRVILEKQLVSSYTRVSFSGVPAGIYMLVILRQNRPETHKIVKK